MAGAVPMTSLGTGYTVSLSDRVFVRETLGRYHVCVRDRGASWAEIVAETKTRAMAEAVVRSLRLRHRKTKTRK